MMNRSVEHLAVHTGDGHALQILRATGDDVDDQELGRIAIDDRARAAHDFDSFDLVDRNAIAKLGIVVEQLRHWVAVEKQEDFPLGAPDATKPGVDAAVHVDAKADSGHQFQHIGQLARARALDLLAGHQRHDVGRIAQVKRPAFGAGRTFSIEEVFQRELGDVVNRGDDRKDLVVGIIGERDVTGVRDGCRRRP